ncbi:MAG: adenylosuccinate synthetase [Bacteroidia bacterium]|nr:adenylosuccinate synthetase [Bacteroidia bacterium]MDW8236482.1 adenylosuccinate synthetase [Bacteroidia bacterium]
MSLQIDAVLGLQWGDEGKGKVVDKFAKGYQAVARFQGGPNAGHTLYHQGQKVVLHQIPSGVFHEQIDLIIGDGAVIDPEVLWKEAEGLTRLGINLRERLWIGTGAHLILPIHKWLEEVSETSQKIGTTRRGIGPAYADRYARRGIPIDWIEEKDFYEKVENLHRLYAQHYSHLSPPSPLSEEFQAGIQLLRSLRKVDLPSGLYRYERILAEGSQGTMLDIFAGTYPYVTSSHTTIAGVLAGLKVSPQAIGKVYGVSKVYTTRVGEGPFPTEIHGDLAAWLQEKGQERGSTTGRLRRCGWLDLVALRYAIQINGVSALILTKADVLIGLREVLVRTGGTDSQPTYTAFPGWQSLSDPAFYTFVRWIERELAVPVSAISTGPEREAWVSLTSRS